VIPVVITFRPEGSRGDVHTVLPAIPSLGHIIDILGTDSPCKVIEVLWGIDVENPLNTAVYLEVEPTQTLVQSDE
jgi:hypothetical protein